MVFSTFQGELVDIDPASLLGTSVITMGSISFCCQLAIIALIIRGYIALPSRVIPWISAVLAMGIAAVTIPIILCISASPADPAGQWLAYLLAMNAAMGTALCQLEIFKVFTVVTPDLSAKDVTRIQIVFFTSFTVGMTGHYANAFNRSNEPEWLALVSTY